MYKSKRLTASFLAVACLMGFVSAKRRSVGVAPRDFPLELERSFAITDPAVLAPFRFARVLNVLVQGTSTTDEALYRQWWDTQNPSPGLDAAMPHCDELLNGFERRCPTTEGKLATDPYRPESFLPIGIINRFDLADPAGSHCGQYRLIFARAQPGPETLHIIFEGALPNPRPEQGLAACRPVAQFWADLSGIDSVEERRARLETFFFDGIEGFAPAIHADHYHRPPAGVRTLQRMFGTVGNNRPPFLFASFFQFRVIRECGSAGCRAIMRPDVLENQPPRTLFDVQNQSDRAKRFRDVFVNNVANLAKPDVNAYFMTIPDEFLLADTQPMPGDEPFDFLRAFRSNRTFPEGQAFEAAIVAELKKMGSNLTAEDVIRRAETQNCVGCHFTGFDIGAGERFPAALDGLQHVTEERIEGNGFAISAAMRNVFIPGRMKILKDFLLSGKPPVHSN